MDGKTKLNSFQMRSVKATCVPNPHLNLAFIQKYFTIVFSKLY